MRKRESTEHVVEVATPEFDKTAHKKEARRGLLMALPSYLYLILFFVIPLESSSYTALPQEIDLAEQIYRVGM